MTTVQHFVNGLKSRNRDEQNKAARDLVQYVKTELREMPQDELVQFYDEFNHHIFDMVSSSDSSEKKGGVLAISKSIIIIIFVLGYSAFYSFHHSASFTLYFLRVSYKRRCGEYGKPNSSLFEFIAQPAAVQRCCGDGNCGQDTGQVGIVARRKRCRIVRF